jgi:hypothetical protein
MFILKAGPKSFLVFGQSLVDVGIAELVSLLIFKSGREDKVYRMAELESIFRRSLAKTALRAPPLAARVRLMCGCVRRIPTTFKLKLQLSQLYHSILNHIVLRGKDLERLR